MHKVSPYLWRGQRPKNKEDLEVLQGLGITHIVNLQSGVYEAVNSDHYEKINTQDYGMTELNLTCSDITPPNKDDVKLFLDLMKKARTESLKVFVHCLHGKDRTGFMCAVYRMQHQGWTFKEAVQEMFSHKFHKLPYIWWLIALRSYERT